MTLFGMDSIVITKLIYTNINLRIMNEDARLEEIGQKTYNI
jgi:hypothetical protein